MHRGTLWATVHEVAESDTTEPLTNTFTFRISITHTDMYFFFPNSRVWSRDFNFFFFFYLRLFSAKQISLGWWCYQKNIFLP